MGDGEHIWLSFLNLQFLEVTDWIGNKSCFFPKTSNFFGFSLKSFFFTLKINVSIMFCTCCMIISFSSCVSFLNCSKTCLSAARFDVFNENSCTLVRVEWLCSKMGLNGSLVKILAGLALNCVALRSS